MRNGIAFPNTLAFRRSLKIGILIGLFCYVALLGVIALTHDHDHCEHAHSEETCTACVYNSQHVGEEIEVVVLTSPFLPSTTLPLYETVFLPLKFTTTPWSRAPPIFFTELANYAFLYKDRGGYLLRVPRFVHLCFATYCSVSSIVDAT